MKEHVGKLFRTIDPMPTFGGYVDDKGFFVSILPRRLLPNEMLVLVIGYVVDKQADSGGYRLGWVQMLTPRGIVWTGQLTFDAFCEEEE